MDHSSYIFAHSYLAESLGAMTRFFEDVDYLKVLNIMSESVVDAIQSGGKVLVAGNGGSAADAQHIAAEFVSRLFLDRAPLPALALTTDSSILTAIGNDYGYEDIFDRQVRALGMSGDVFLGISTSGRSPNVLRALASARQRGIVTLGFTGEADSSLSEHCDLVFRAPSTKTAIVQQLHITAGHILCGLVERHLCALQSTMDSADSPSSFPV